MFCNFLRQLVCIFFHFQATLKPINLFRVKFSEILNNLEEHIIVSHDNAVEYTLAAKDGVPEGFEMLQTSQLSKNTSLANLSSGKENETSGLHSSDSDGGKFLLYGGILLYVFCYSKLLVGGW